MSTTNKHTNLAIGAVFTPAKWAEFAIDEFGLLEKWLSGKTIFDPTMGDGGLLETLIAKGIAGGKKIDELPVENLYGVELNSRFYQAFFERINKKYGIVLPKENFRNMDIFHFPATQKFDIIFGNPPWKTFADLPEAYKEFIKPKFLAYDLVSGTAQQLLLGGSRIDIAALVIKKTIAENLQSHGEAIYFVPLSLFLNDGSHQGFRNYKVNDALFAVEKLYDFHDSHAFENISTRYGLAKFVRDIPQQFPVAYLQRQGSRWKKYCAAPLLYNNDAWSVTAPKEITLLKDFRSIVLQKDSAPRQGINTCGANTVFFFTDCREAGDNHYLLNNTHVLPKKYIFPLLTGSNFKTSQQACKWVLLPYDMQTGKPLNWSEIAQEETLSEYFLKHRSALQNRKGTLINTWIKKGIWWALLGVGKYNFYPYKIVWEAYGRTSFEPQIIDGHWQANQSLQAFIPVKSRQEAEEIHRQLADKRIENYLRSRMMSGGMSWAQPGTIKKLVTYS